MHGKWLIKAVYLYCHSEFGPDTKYGWQFVTPCHLWATFNRSIVVNDSCTLCLGTCKPDNRSLPMIMVSPISVRSVGDQFLFHQ